VAFLASFLLALAPGPPCFALSDPAPAREAASSPVAAPPPTTALGALIGHITGGAAAATFQPMNVNFGLFPPLPDLGKRGPKGADRKSALARRALADLTAWLGGPGIDRNAA